jgi:hypothetical protein
MNKNYTRAELAALIPEPFRKEETHYAVPPVDVAPATQHYGRRSEASCVALRNGRVFAAYGNHANPHDNSKGHIACVELDHTGARVADERLLIPTPEGAMNVMSPALRRLPDGRIAMAYSHRDAIERASRKIVFSEDEGRSWTPPVTVAVGDPDNGNYITGCHDRFTILLDGKRLLLPCHQSRGWGKTICVRVARSDNGGATWTLSKPIRAPHVEPDQGRGDHFWLDTGLLEPSIAECPDGSLLLIARTATGTLWRSQSFDRGATWTNPGSLEITSPSAPGYITRIPGSKDLLLLWTPTFDLDNHHFGPRRTIAAAVSSDGGKSWPMERRKLLVHDPDHSVDYPSILFNGDDVWVTLRRSAGPGILENAVSTILVVVPKKWFYETKP